MNEDRITYFGETDSRNKRVKFGIKAKDRTKHVYVIGKTGMGKSTLLENMAVQDIQNGEGMAFIDPHGKTADLLLEYVPAHRQKDVVYFAPFDMDHPISFNVLESVDPDKRHLVVSGLMSTFKKIWQDAWSARMEYILTNTLLALLEYPEATLLGVNRMLSDKEYRKLVISHVTDSSVKAFWVQEFANYTERMAAEAVPAIQNKIGQFTANALIRNMIGQPKSSFDIRAMMDQSKIFIINLSKGRIGESNANLLGGMLITKIYLAALSRADVPDRVLKTLPNFYLFVDEFQSFANESFADILSEARKYKLNLTIAHQYIEQMEEEVSAAVFGNVGTMIVFRVGAVDAEVLEKEFSPQFTAEDIVNLGIFQIYLKLMIDGISSPPFSATTLPPISKPDSSNMEDVIAMSRQQFSRNRVDVEKQIDEWMAPIKAPVKDKAPVPTPQSPTLPTRPVAPTVPTASHVSNHAPFHAPLHAPVPRPIVASMPPSTPIVPPVVQQSHVHAPAQNPVQTPTHHSSQSTQSAHPMPSVPPRPSTPSVSSTPPIPPAPFIAKMKSVPLSSLAQQPRQNNNNQKDAIPQRVNELKNALANALSHGAIRQPHAMPTVPPTVVPNTSSIMTSSIVNIENSKGNTKEIPEDVLRNVLKVD